MEDQDDPSHLEHLMNNASEEQLLKMLRIAVDALDEYALENADLDTALVAFECRAVLEASEPDRPRR